MAGVYIKGMVMPAFCHVCPMYRIHHTGFSFCKFNNNAIPIVINGDNLFARPDWCPLVEVPDHGDLIERDTVVDKVCEGIPCSECQFNEYPYDSCVLQTNLEKLKVVIHADNGEKEET